MDNRRVNNGRLGDFERYLAAEERERGTIEKYLRDAGTFVAWLGEREVTKGADVLGHSSMETTRIYLVSTGAEHARQLDRLGLIS